MFSVLFLCLNNTDIIQFVDHPWRCCKLCYIFLLCSTIYRTNPALFILIFLCLSIYKTRVCKLFYVVNLLFDKVKNNLIHWPWFKRKFGLLRCERYTTFSVTKESQLFTLIVLKCWQICMVLFTQVFYFNSMSTKMYYLYLWSKTKYNNIS